MGKNIVMLTMGLNIGGAETHIVELACVLKEKGHHITVFSSGGAFTDHLKVMGVDHIDAPMNSKKLSSLLCSYRVLASYCRQKRVDVIHSHTRITNFIAHLICKKFHIPMVTTVHGRFSLGFFQRLFSRWGDRQLAVSEDLRQYVTKGYHIPAENVHLTVNGINLKNFSEKIDPELQKQFGFTEKHQVIVCVTRIDPDASESAFRLLDAAPIIYRALPTARILIVGGGKQFVQLAKKADQINGQTEEHFIQLAGPQINIPSFLHLGDVFVGVSRAALEAMACGIPTVLMGNAGYLGVYSKEIHQACIDTNFTCRGYKHAAPKTVADTLTDILTHPANYRTNAMEGQALVKERYSVDTMAEDALTVYSQAWEALRPEDLMISGYYGTHNFGDDVTLHAIINNISNQYPLKRIIVLNHTANEPSDDPRVTIVHRFNLWRILPLMKKTKLFMLGGGSLLQDVTSNRSLFYYIFMLWHAKKYGCRTMIYANGIGPLTQSHHQKQVTRLLKRLDRITIRDTISYQYLLDNGFTPDEVQLTADEAYSYNYQESAPLPSDLPRIDQKILLINLRSYSGYPKDISADVAQAVEKICRNNDLFPVLMPVQFDQDYTILRNVSKKLSIDHHLFKKRLNEKQIIAVIEHCDYLLTERLHPLVFAARMQKPFTCIVYDPKVDASAKRFRMDAYALPINKITPHLLGETLQNMIENASEIRQTVAPIAEQLYTAARCNSKIAGELLGE